MLAPNEPPASGSWRDNVRFDLVSGFLVFLIALPLCLAISRASNFPPIAGIWTAVLGGLIATWISNSALTIKGPAAGLIVIVAGAVTALGEEFGAGLSSDEKLMLGYRLTLGIGVASGILQVLFGLLRVGRLGDFFPLAAVHGLLAAIGIIIISKQINIVLGSSVRNDLGPVQLLLQLPASLRNLNPAIAFIGIISLLILFGVPFIKNPILKRIPAQMLVLVVAIPLGLALKLDHQHTYLFPDNIFELFGPDGEKEQMSHLQRYEIGPRFLVDMPEVLKEPEKAFFFPDFRALASLVGLKWLLMFALIGSLESLLSAKAVDLIDPQHRKTNLDRDLAAIGVANTAAAFIGGLPMISEIVRSSANANNGARSRLANFFHGLFLLGFVLFLPNLIHQIPLAALAAMLIYTGFRLAHPYEFIKNWRIGKEQLLVFLTTIVLTLVEDMLIGVLAGIAVEFLLYCLHGVSLGNAFKPEVNIEQQDEVHFQVRIQKSAVFTNWIQLKSRILKLGPQSQVTIDLSNVHFVDHNVMEKLHELENDFIRAGGRLEIVGLEEHRKLSGHAQSARKSRG